MNKNFKKYNRGYTIIETMISVSLFLVVVSISINSLLGANVSFRKTKDINSVMDNLSFIVEDMVRNIRVGSGYLCDGVGYCDSGSNISFIESTSGERWIYKIEAQAGEPFAIYKSINNGTTFVKLTDDFIEIDGTSSFSLLGGLSHQSGDLQQPFVVIRLKGFIINQNIKTDFNLQTSASQRSMDLYIP